MVFKCKFLKKRIVHDYDPSADETQSWDLSDHPLAAIWLGIKGDFAADEENDDDLMDLVTSIDVWMGGFNCVHYDNTPIAVMMNMLLKQSRYMKIGNGQDTDDINGVYFPIVFGAPYLNREMCLPYSLTNKKYIELGLDIATSSFDDLLISIDQVIIPEARPTAFIKQEEVSVSAPGTGDKDFKLQTNWDLLKMIFECPTVPADAAWTATINRAGLEIDDFVYGYQNVEWEVLHAELMDEISGMAGIECHFHDDPSAGVTGFPEDLEHWIRYFAVMDFFFHKDPYWRAPIAGASTAKIKANIGVDEAFYYAQANYVPTAQVA